MEAQGVAFPYLMIQMYRSGEASGSMDKTALIMADQYTKDHRIKGKKKSAMTYPIILIIVTILVLLIVYLMVLPSFFDIFKNVDLPLITQINIGISLLSKIIGISYFNICFSYCWFYGCFENKESKI